MTDDFKEYAKLFGALALIGSICVGIDQISAMNRRAEYKASMERSNAAFAQSQKEAADKKESDRKRRLAAVMDELNEESRQTREIEAIRLAEWRQRQADNLAQAEEAQRKIRMRQEEAAAEYYARISEERRRADLSSSSAMAVQGVNPRFWATPPPKESTTPAIPQDFEIEERGNFWFGSDGSGGHIRRSPSGRTIYGR